MEQITMGEVTPEYQAFVDKFKPKLTTDDCYTPPLVYEAVKQWACKEYGIEPERIVRPFWPGGDYQRFDYPEGAVVLDNPPFSILSEIQAWYLDRGIPFFLFAPELTALSGGKAVMRTNHIICDASITYANGAVVKTAFVTSFGGDCVAQTAPSLKRAVDEAMKETRKATKTTLPKYEYPMNVVTAAMIQRYSKYGVDYKVRRGDCTAISKLDAQRVQGKAIFGGGGAALERQSSGRTSSGRTSGGRTSGGGTSKRNQVGAERPRMGDRQAAGEVKAGKRSENEQEAGREPRHEQHYLPLLPLPF